MGSSFWQKLRAVFGLPPPLEPLEVLAEDPLVLKGIRDAYDGFSKSVKAMVEKLGPVGVPANPHIKAIGGYTILRELGRGGMGAVYLAQLENGPLVVIKVPFSEFGTDPQYVEIFFREFQALSTVRHENIVRVFRFGQDPLHNVYYYVAEFVDGVTLKELVEGQPEKPFTPTEAAAVVLATLRALRFLRDRNVTHRDLKLGNVMFNQQGEVKLIDFGAAKIAGQSSELTNAGVMLGTFDYMAPEAGQKNASRTVGVERDIFAVGIMCYRLLKGRLPNDFGGGQDAAIAFARFCDSRKRVLRDTKGFPPLLGHLLHRLTERDPSKRLTDFDEIECRLAQIIKIEAARG